MSAIRLQIQPTSKPELFVRHWSLSNKRDQKWLEEVEKYITHQMANPTLSVTSMAMEFFMSERQFYRKLKLLSRMTPNRFLREIRLKKAYQLLISGDYENIKTVSAMVGYKRVDYFSNLFETRYNRRPLDLSNAFGGKIER